MNSQLLFILVIASVAGIVLFRLYTVLGRRTGHERPPQDPLARLGHGADKIGDNVVPLPDRAARAEMLDQPGDPLARGLLDIKLADRNFVDARFLTGAKAAYEMVITAFAKGDRVTFRPLLSDEVYGAFDGVMRERERRKQKVSLTFVGFGEVKITEAALKRRMAEITVSFSANYISATLDAEGNIAEGDPKAVRSVCDVWTFARDVKADNPNWTIIATHGDDV